MVANPKPSPSRALALGGAILLIAASAALGAYFGFTLGNHTHVALGVIFAGAALGGEILKPLAVLGAVDAFRAHHWLRGAIAATLAAICIVYSLSAELTLAAGSRGDLAASRQATQQAVSRAHERRERAAAELASLQPARPMSVLAAEITALEATPGANGCAAPPDGPISRRVCASAGELRSEAARFDRRQELQRQLFEADAILDANSGKVGAADPLASALAAYAASLGRPIEPETLAPWLALIPVLFLEVGSAFALVVARGIGETPSAAPAPVETAVPETASRTPPPPDSGLGAKVINFIEANGGEIQGGQRGIAQALGVSKSRLNELLRDLAQAGAVQLSTSASGTRVRLATA